MATELEMVLRPLLAAVLDRLELPHMDDIMRHIYLEEMSRAEIAALGPHARRKDPQVRGCGPDPRQRNRMGRPDHQAQIPFLVPILG